MNLFITIRIAMRALAKNKLRAGLTVLGVVIGIAAVTTMVSLGQSGTELVQGQLRNLGTNVVIVQSSSSQRGPARRADPTLTEEDYESIVTECPAVLAASPLVSAAGLQVIYGNSNCRPSEMMGCGPEYLKVRNMTLRAGYFFNQSHINNRTGVCVIGQTVVAKLFQTQNPLGETVRIKKTSFRIIGVLDKKGANLVGQDQDNIVLMPYTTVQKRLQSTANAKFAAIMVSATSPEAMRDAEKQINQILIERHHITAGKRKDFQVQNMADIANIFGAVMATITLMLAAIAGISLLVGGVGIMNIMLVSVTERTREIGIRMAMGARSRDILWQFLIESILLSCIGGAVGILLGIGASVGLTLLINALSSGSDWPVVISIPAAVIALAFAAAVGIFFGFYPARRASRLDPIEALRYE